MTELIQNSIIVNEKIYFFKTVIKNIKHTYISIKNNEIIVNTNKYIHENVINSFLKKYITKYSNKLTDKQSFEGKIAKSIYVLGKKYNLQKINSKKNKIDIIDNNIYLFIKNENKLKNEINKIYIKIAESDVRKRLKFGTEKMKITNIEIKFKGLNRVWGYFCAKPQPYICISSRALCYTMETIDYIIVHELCHTIHGNHSKFFGNLVERYIPNYKEVKNNLL